MSGSIKEQIAEQLRDGSFGKFTEKLLTEYAAAAAHTRGPWTLHFPDGDIEATGMWGIAFQIDRDGPIAAGRLAARDEDGSGKYSNDVAQANARLIAAAPDLLAELENIANADPSKWHPETRDQFREWAQNRARAAIAKATQP